MKKKIFAVVCLIIGIGFLVGGIVLFVFNKQELDKSNDELRTAIIKDYDVFKTKVENFSDTRIAFYALIDSDIRYSEDLPKNYDKLIKDFQNYEAILKDIEESSETLKKNCLENEFDPKDVEITRKVDAFISSYEQVFNLFIDDTKYLNERIAQYNAWVDTQTASTYKKLNEYETSYKDYVDVNDDKVFNGVKDEDSSS